MKHLLCVVERITTNDNWSLDKGAAPFSTLALQTPLNSSVSDGNRSEREREIGNVLKEGKILNEDSFAFFVVVVGVF